jgi:hypothetical protein
MDRLNTGQALDGLSEAQATALAAKLETFWRGLSPAEQTHLNAAFMRVIEEPPDVTGFANMVEVPFILFTLSILQPPPPK